MNGQNALELILDEISCTIRVNKQFQSKSILNVSNSCSKLKVYDWILLLYVRILCEDVLNDTNNWWREDSIAVISCKMR